MSLFPTLHAALTAFRAFDLFDNGWLGLQDLEYALIAVGLGDAPKQHINALLRQSREKKNPSSVQPQAPLRTSMAHHPFGSSFSGNSSVQHHVQHAHRDIVVTIVGAVPDRHLSPTSPGSPLGSLQRIRSIGSGSSSTEQQSVRVTLEEFLYLVKEMSPPAGSNDEVWRAFKLLDAQQCGRVTLTHLSDVAFREGGFTQTHPDGGAAAAGGLSYDPAMTYTFDPSPARVREPLDDDEAAIVPVPYGQLEPPSAKCKDHLATFLTTASEVRDANRGATIDDFRSAFRR